MEPGLVSKQVIPLSREACSIILVAPGNCGYHCITEIIHSFKTY